MIQTGSLWGLVFILVNFEIELSYGNSFTNGCVCLGDTLTYNCTVMGSFGGSTIWRGSALSGCEPSDDEIVLLHSRFTMSNGTFGVCNNKTVVGRSLRVEGSDYTSQLNVTVTRDIIGETIMCVYEATSSEIVLFSETINTTDLLPPPNNILVRAVSFDSRALTFAWSPVAPDCPSLHYNILASNCGSCPTTTTNTTVTCNDVPTNGTTCTFAVETVVCRNIVGNLSESVNVTTFLKVRDDGSTNMQGNTPSLSIVIIGAVMLCIGIIIPILACLLYKPIKKSIINPLCNRRQLQNNVQGSISKEEMGLSTYYRCDEASPERTLDIRTSGIYGQLDNQGPLTLESLVNRLHGQLPTTQWFRFGQAIGVPKEVLNSLERYSERDRLVEMLDYWLKHHHSEPTWMEVREAQRKAEYYERTDDPTHYSALNRTSAAFSVSSSAPPKPPRRRSSVNKPNSMCAKDDKQVYARTSHIILPKREGSINL